MKAVVCKAPLELAVVERAMPSPGPGDVVLRVRRVGLCGTDYHIFAGNQPFLTYPRVMGHELGGTVVAAPAGSPWREGQVVTVNPYIACGQCRACTRGKPNCCAAISVLGVHADGGMCDYLVVPERAVVDAAGLTLDQAAMVEFLAIGAHAVARARLTPGDRVLVVGGGPIGVAVGQFARAEGAKVTLLDTRAVRLEHARERLGFGDTLLVSPDLVAQLAARTDGAMFDCVFDATGNIHAMRKGLDYVAHGGTYVLVSVVKDDLVFADPEFHKRETTLLGSRNALNSDFDRVIAAIRNGTIPTAMLHTHSISAADMPVKVPELIAAADSVLKAIVEF